MHINRPLLNVIMEIRQYLSQAKSTCICNINHHSINNLLQTKTEHLVSFCGSVKMVLPRREVFLVVTIQLSTRAMSLQDGSLKSLASWWWLVARSISSSPCGPSRQPLKDSYYLMIAFLQGHMHCGAWQRHQYVSQPSFRSFSVLLCCMCHIGQ